MNKTALLLILLISLCSVRVGVCDSTEVSAGSDSATASAVLPYTLRFDRLLIDDMKVNDTLELMFESNTEDVAGFGLKFGCDGRYFQIAEVLRGEIPDSCEWELFRSVPVPSEPGEDGVRQLWEVSGFARVSPDPEVMPPCLTLGRPASLVKLVLSNEGIREVPDHAAPIFFYWEECRDNVLSDTTGTSLFISMIVYDSEGKEIPAVDDGFPSRSGTPQSCINLKGRNYPRRRIEFHNGAVEFRLELGQDTVTSSQ